jgi:hypothetical protein
MQTIGELGFDLAQTFSTGLVDSFNDALWKVNDLSEALENLGLTMAQMVTKWLLMQAAMNAMSAIGGLFGGKESDGGGLIDTTALVTAGSTVSAAITTAGTTAGIAITTAGEIAAASIAASSAASAIAHGGGTVGRSFFPKRTVPAAVFAGAPRLHHGLASDEYPAILQSGEEVVPRGGGGLGKKLDRMISILSTRQTINANIIDRRDIVTRERIEGREGETWTVNHMQRNA